MQGRKETATIEKKQEQDRIREVEGCRLLLVQEDPWGQQKERGRFQGEVQRCEEEGWQQILGQEGQWGQWKEKNNINAVKKMVADNY